MRMLSMGKAQIWQSLSYLLLNRLSINIYTTCQKRLGNMHELGITENILSIVSEHAEEKGASKIIKIHLRIGEMTQIVDDCINFYFEQLSEGTIAEGAELIFEHVPITVRCSACGMEKEASDYDFICPSCKTVCIEFLSGRELAVDNIEIE